MERYPLSMERIGNALCKVLKNRKGGPISDIDFIIPTGGNIVNNILRFKNKNTK